MKKKLVKPIFLLLLSICVAVPITFASGTSIKAHAYQTEVSYGGTIRTRDGNGVNVRASASINGRKIGALSDGTNIRIDDYKNGWAHIIYPMHGWVYNRYISHYNYNE